MVKLVLTTILILTTANASASASTHSHSELGAIAARALEGRALSKGLNDVKVEITPLDSRVNLPKCDGPVNVLRGTNQPTLGRVTVGLRCQTPQPWTIYFRGRVTSSVDIPVLKQPVNRSELIGDDDVALKNLQIDADLKGFIIDRRKIVGKVAIRNLTAGQPLRHSDLKAYKIISRGQSVTIKSVAGGLTVTMKGKALGNASEGDRLWVQNHSSKKRVEGEVTAEGEVVIR